MYSGEMKCIRFLPGFHEDFMMGGGHTHTVMYIGGMPYWRASEASETLSGLFN